MKLAFIVPTAYVAKFGGSSDFTLALSHLMDKREENDYEKAITELGKPIVMDNGLFENGVPESIEDVLVKAVRVGATHFFAPDVLYDTEATYLEVDRAIRRSKDLKIKMGAVVQADNVKDYIQQLLVFNANKHIDLIGISILAVPKSYEEQSGKFDVTESRLALLKEMIKLSERGVVWKDCHLLGLGDSYADVIYARDNCPWVVSNDTSCCFQSGLFGQELEGELLEVPGGKIQTKVDFDQENIDVASEYRIINNFNKVITTIKDDN